MTDYSERQSLDQVRERLDQLAMKRLAGWVSVAEQRQYDDLCEAESSLLRRAGGAAPARPT